MGVGEIHFMDKRDVDILRELAMQTAEIAALPVQEKKRRLWRKLNGLQPERPMVMIDQLCWHEMTIDDELTLRCGNPECRQYEQDLRRILFQWRHFPVDRVVEPYIQVRKAVHSTGLGIEVQEETAVTDPASAVVAHKYTNQFQNEEDLEKIRVPVVSHDRDETERRLSMAHDIFDDCLEIKLEGVQPYVGLWDPISSWMGVEEALYALVDRPEFMHRLVARLTDAVLDMLDQLEQQGLLCGPQNIIHCTGAYTDDLPAPGYDPAKPRTRDLWMFGLAQMFCSVSPAMLKAFEVDYTRRICERFGLVYYGCCEPLDGKMAQVRRLPNLRKVSMSPWSDRERGAAEIGRDYVYSCKPNPALLAASNVALEEAGEELRNVVGQCKNHGCPLEIILKDISTVRYQPQRIIDWSKMAMELVEAY